jgi:hypothetical protein
LVNSQIIAEPNDQRIKEISEDILKSMLKRSYPAVDATHFFKKYADGKTPDHQFMHALAMMDKGGILRIDKKEKPFSVTFVLMEDGKPKMHHMIDDDYGSDTFGSMMNDPYEGDKKRIHCFSHIMDDEKAKVSDCEKCKLEINSTICMNHGNVLSKCEKCKKSSQEFKDLTPKEDADKTITAILKEYKKQYWSFEK